MIDVKGKFSTILADPPWKFMVGGEASPSKPTKFHYEMMDLKDIQSLPVLDFAEKNCHLYLWVPMSLLDDGISTLKKWGFKYKTCLVWRKIKKDGNTSAANMGFYFRNSAEMCVFGVRGRLHPISRPSPSNIISAPRREHSRKPDEVYDVIEKISPGPYLELFARTSRPGWVAWGNEIDKF